MSFWIGYVSALATILAIDLTGFTWLIIRERHYDHKRNHHSKGDK
ncbi:hypothetical protein [Bifidobacterium sp. ESL0745]|nr:hypothetical protein [Bifidobacterium sp. ESL0745]MDF7665715.1 hypothetical protein [Bifidobacterium sp. ESL0745]